MQRNIVKLPIVSTTMEAVKQYITPQKLAVAVLAEQQQCGLGAGGRSWYSPLGNMYLTIALDTALVPDPILPVFSLFVGLAVRQSLASSGHTFLLKWPNDILNENGQKVSGTLIQSYNDMLLVGIGVNVASCPEILDGGRESGSLHLSGWANATAESVANMCWDNLFERLRQEKNVSRLAVVDEYRKHMNWKTTMFKRNADGSRGIAVKGVNLTEWGHLIVRDEEGNEETLMASYLFYLFCEKKF